jgi:Fur family transcriptional regulator, peroxide stress response regulator
MEAPARNEGKARQAAVERRCEAAGITLTVQRRAVLRSLSSRFDHPTPDDVYEDVVASTPGVSRATVYRILDKLAKRGLITRVSHMGPAARYDVHVGRHHHVVCERCGAMRDLEDARLDAIRIPRAAERGFQVRDYSVHIRGVCARCADPGRSRKPVVRSQRRSR